MAQSPNPPSVVLKTAAPTPAQKAQIASLKPPAPRPVLPNNGPAAPWMIGRGAPQGVGSQKPAPVKTNKQGFVTSPVGASFKTGSGATVTAKAKPTAKVILHPNGSVEIQHHAPAVVPAPSSAGTVATPAPAPAKPGRAAAATTTVPRPATSTPAAPVQTVEQQAQALLDPVEKAATDAINQRIAAQQAAINSSAQTLAGLMGKYAPASAAGFGQAEQGQAALDAATGATLAGQGQQGQDELAAKLQAINADPGTTARLTGTAAANTAGAVGAQAGRGSASLSDLISRGASAANYGATLPGVAGMYGLQSTRAAQAQGTTDTANAIAQLEAKYPDLVQSIRQSNNQNRQINFEHGAALLQAGGKVTPAIAKLLGGALPAGTTTIAAKNAKTSTTRAGDAQANADRNYQLAVKRVGLSELKLKKQFQKDLQAQATKGKLHGLSQHEYQAASATALGLARVGHVPYKDAAGTVHQAVSWQAYLNGALAKKVPMWVAIEQGKRVYSQPEIRQGLIPGAGPKGK